MRAFVGFGITTAHQDTGKLLGEGIDARIPLSASGREIVRLEVDAPVLCLTAVANFQFVAGDESGRLHWLEIVD